MSFENTEPARFSPIRIAPVSSLCLTLLLSLSVNPSPALANQGESVEQLISKADELMKQKKFSDAKKSLNKALQLDKNSSEANALFSIVYREENNRKEAIKHAYAALRNSPQRPDLHYFLAVLLYETLESGQAKIELEKAMSLGASFANAYILKGDLEIEEQNYGSAVEAYQKALKLIPETDAGRQKIQEMAEALTAYLASKDKKVADNPTSTKPKLLNLPMPRYTADARSNHITGAVKVRALVNDAGRIQYVLLLNRLGYGLDEEAIKALLRTKFLPATVNNQPVPFWIVMEVTFNLQ